MILVDTSVWVDHLRGRNAHLVALLEGGQVAAHPFVVGELALGYLKHREAILELLGNLPAAQIATHDEVMHLVGAHHMQGAGIGWVDAHLIASALLSHARVWTHDRRLRTVAEKLKVAHLLDIS